jgi:hypothetical protein
MTTITTPLRRLLPAAFLAAAVALGGPAVASAVWDIEKYDECMKGRDPNDLWEQKYCCANSGGKWIDTSDDGWIFGGTCVAPPAGEGGGTAPPPKAGDSAVPIDNPPVNPGPGTPLRTFVPTVPVLPAAIG